MLTMSTQPDFIKHSQLVGRLVLDRQTMAEVGKINRVWLNTNNHRVLGITCSSGMMGLKKASIAWDQIYSIGKDTILVGIKPDAPPWEKPEGIESIIDYELITDTGNRAGKIDDYLLEPISGVVVSYIYQAIDKGNFLNRRFLLNPEAIISIGSRRVQARAQAVDASEPYTDGLNRLILQAKEFIIEDGNRTIQHLDGVKNQLTQLVAQFREEAPPKLEQMATKVQELAEQAKDKTQPLISQALDQAQSIAQPLIEQAKDAAQTLGEEAKKHFSKSPEVPQEATQTIDITGNPVLESGEADSPETITSPSGDSDQGQSSQSNEASDSSPDPQQDS